MLKANYWESMKQFALNVSSHICKKYDLNIVLLIIHILIKRLEVHLAGKN